MMYLLFLAPALVLMAWAQGKVKSTYAAAQRIPTSMSGAEVARFILDDSGLQHIPVEAVAGQLSDHYDPQTEIVRLSADVFQGYHAAAVGIAAHEVGHALQDATNYAPLVIRNAAVPAAKYGPTISMVLFFIGAALNNMGLIILAIGAYASVCLFQLINLPVEFNASDRAKELLQHHGLVDGEGAIAVNDVLNSAAWTYVAGTLQSILQVLYFVLRMFGGRSR